MSLPIFFLVDCTFAAQSEQTKTRLENTMDIQQLAQCAPAINLTITAADLKEFAVLLIAETKAELEQSISDSKAETYLSSEKVMQMMEISKTTLWRWKQRGYLVPVRVGGNERYRMSDINKILEG